MSRPLLTLPKPCISHRKSADKWNASVRTHIGTFDTREEAELACAQFLITGCRPQPKRRGPKLGSKMPHRKPRAYAPRKRVAAPPRPFVEKKAVTPPIDRLALLRASYARTA